MNEASCKDQIDTDRDRNHKENSIVHVQRVGWVQTALYSFSQRKIKTLSSPPCFLRKIFGKRAMLVAVRVFCDLPLIFESPGILYTFISYKGIRGIYK